MKTATRRIGLRTAACAAESLIALSGCTASRQSAATTAPGSGADTCASMPAQATPQPGMPMFSPLTLSCACQAVKAAWTSFEQAYAAAASPQQKALAAATAEGAFAQASGGLAQTLMAQSEPQQDAVTVSTSLTSMGSDFGTLVRAVLAGDTAAVSNMFQGLGTGEQVVGSLCPH
jgi:hypothetical protein